MYVWIYVNICILDLRGYSNISYINFFVRQELKKTIKKIFSFNKIPKGVTKNAY